MSFVDEMSWRGLIKQVSHETLGEVMRAGSMTLYSGFDPTASSLHVGNLMPVMAMVRAQRHGHTPVVLVGGATGMIGDPSGKASERKLLDAEELHNNSVGIHQQLERFVDFSGKNAAKMVNNYDWFKGLGYLEFMRDVGKHFSVNMMLAKDSVKTRLEDRDSGISYTEFSYMLIQAYDYLWLSDHHDCRLQIGGSEQWGNITAGMELIRRMRGKEAYAMTLPLLVDAEGKKFGKSEQGAVWLDTSRTSVYDFYQYFLRADDRDVPKLLRFLTLLPLAEIEAIEREHLAAPEKRHGQKVLAREMTTLVHGAAAFAEAEKAAAALFGPRAAGAIPEGAPTFAIAALPLSLVDALVQSGLCSSKKDARREMEGGGVYVNDVRIQKTDHALTEADLRDGAILLRRGKKSYMVLRLGS